MHDTASKSKWQSSQFGNFTPQPATPLFVPGRPKAVAFFNPHTRTLQKGIDFTKHLVLKPRAIAFDAAVLSQAERLGAQHVQVKNITTGDIWTITFDDFRRYQFSVNRGFGLQYATELGRWQRNDQPSELGERERQQANKTAQLGMFDQPDYLGGYK